MIYIFDEDGEVPDLIVNGAGIATNRNAIGPITAKLPVATMGDRYELHSVEWGIAFTVAMPDTHVFLVGENRGSSITINGGGYIVCVKTKPAVWTGVISGDCTVNE